MYREEKKEFVRVKTKYRINCILRKKNVFAGYCLTTRPEGNNQSTMAAITKILLNVILGNIKMVYIDGNKIITYQFMLLKDVISLTEVDSYLKKEKEK